MALATHVTSWCWRRPRRAVVRPPLLRRVEPSAAIVTGPRFETTISLRRTAAPYPLRRGRNDRDFGARRVVPEQLVEQHEPVAQEPGREEVAADVLLPAQ